MSANKNDTGKERLPFVEKLIDIGSYPVVNVLDLLLQDKSTKKNIIWATDVTIHSRPKPVKWKTKEIIFCLKANQRLSGRCDLSGC